MASSTPHSYDATKQHVSTEHVNKFLNEACLWHLKDVPGIGPHSTVKLRESQVPDDIRITSTYGLIGIFLALATEGETMQQHCDHFMEYLHKHDLHHNNHEITHAICHKVANLFPELYSVEGHKAGKGKAERSPHVASSPVIPGA